MPTISQLPSVAQVTSADEVPLSQNGVTHSVSLGTLLGNVQPAIITGSGTLLGRSSLGAGGPETISVGTGLVLTSGTLVASGADTAGFQEQTALVMTDQAVLNSAGNPMLLSLSLLRGLFSAGSNISISSTGTISANVTSGGTSGQTGAYSIASLTPVTTIAVSDLVAISQSGTDHTISYGNFIDGLTIDLAQPAVAVTSTDMLWVAQGSSTMLRQTFAAVWSWIMSQLPSYKLQVVEITSNTTLDGTVHNGRTLICSQPVTLSPAALNMGSGFYCDVLNLSAGIVTLGAGITTSSGLSSLPSGQVASLRCITYSGGTVVFAGLASGGGSGVALTAPGQVGGLGASNATSSSVALHWSAPGSGGSVSSYTVQYRVSGTTTWLTSAVGIGATNASVSSLVAATAYDFQVYAVNGGGAGLPSVVVNAATAAAAGAVISVTWQTAPSGSFTHGAGTLGVNAHVNPATAPIQFGFSTSVTLPPTSWTTAAYINADFWGAYVPTPDSAGTWYAWVEGTDGSAATVYPIAFTVT